MGWIRLAWDGLGRIGYISAKGVWRPFDVRSIGLVLPSTVGHRLGFLVSYGSLRRFYSFAPREVENERRIGEIKTNPIDRAHPIGQDQ